MMFSLKKLKKTLPVLCLIAFAVPAMADYTTTTTCTGASCSGSGTNINNNSNAVSNAQLSQADYSRNTAISVSNPIGTFIPSPAPSGFANSMLSNGAWNFIPPHVLFHPSKTIGGNSPFCKCRIIKASTRLRSTLKDKILGVFDERKFIASGVGYTRPAPAFAGAGITTDSVIVCGLNTNLPNKCVNFIGSGSVFMENYATSEGALVGLAQMAAQNGANLVGNVNCAFSESIQSYNGGLGLGGSITDSLGGSSTGIGTLGASWGTGITKRRAQPYCSADFFVVTLSGCTGSGTQHMPAPRMYRRYLPSQGLQSTMPQPKQQMMAVPVSNIPQQPQVQAMPTYRPQQPVQYNQIPVRGQW